MKRITSVLLGTALAAALSFAQAAPAPKASTANPTTKAKKHKKHGAKKTSASTTHMMPKK